jgi:hypothetical protein
MLGMSSSSSPMEYQQAAESDAACRNEANPLCASTEYVQRFGGWLVD